MSTKTRKQIFPIISIVTFLAIVSFGCNSNEPVANNGTTQPKETPKEKIKIKKLVDSELLILEITKRLKNLNRDAKNLLIPGEFSSDMFAEGFVTNRVSFADAPKLKEKEYASTIPLNVSDDLTSLGAGSMWSEMLQRIDFFDRAEFYFVSGKFAPEQPEIFDSKMGFKAVAVTKEGSRQSITAKLKVRWVREAESDPADGTSWQISKLDIDKLNIEETPTSYFQEILADVCSDADTQKMRFSQHSAFMEKLVSTGSLVFTKKRDAKYFAAGQTFQHPGVSMVDLNNDGWEDIYICDEWVTNKLLISDGKGGYREAAKEYGLDLDLPATSSIFADFDNDGDKDVFIARCYDDCALMFNENGKFYDRTSSNLLCKAPFLVTSVAANDFNNDGLIDLYLSTYGYASGSEKYKDWVHDFLSPEDFLVYQERVQVQERFLSAFGPSNLLLQNIGDGKFSIAAENKYIKHHHNTFQSVWVDYDQDGDQDLYVCNDYAQDFLYRNDGGTFKDVTFEVGSKEMMGFGMGAGFGDFDADGDFDLYVSNMFSKAGTRILEQVPGLDEWFCILANGNRLYKHENGKLVCQPATNDNAMNAGWAWGGQFTDFDNDGLLDLYVGSGYLTSPFDDDLIDDL